jgi:L-alanine-DL-glutamate epimerase-like enolase superfamily enzyme
MPGFSKTVGTLPFEIPDDYANELNQILKYIEALSNNTFQVIVDLNYNVTPPLFKKLEPILHDAHVRWVEIDFDEITAFNAITSSTTLPLCSGENLLTLWNYHKLLSNPAIQIISIDLFLKHFLILFFENTIEKLTCDP